ncbi:Mur ligase family protein, partial [Staphylococcus pseudintermedius]|uniref:Mur ligase family protein n=1 Tax=Staphylococcus pseudintermedius TaxID=283734 RepID=UPI003C6F01BF
PVVDAGGRRVRGAGDGRGQAGRLAYLAAIARPDIGLVNLIAPAHLERMGSVEGVAETMGALYQALPAGGVA